MSETIIVLQYLGAITLAMTGCLVAAKKKADILAFILLGLTASVGGGTLRDLLIGRTPVFWVENPNYILIATMVGFLMFRGMNHMKKIKYYEFYLVWTDAIGLATFTIVGTHIALQADVSNVAAVLLGVMSASFGGVLRDLIAGEETLIFRQDIYMMAGIIGSVSYILCLNLTPIPEAYLTYGCMAIIFIIRGLAIVYNLKMPGYRYFENEDK